MGAPAVTVRCPACGQELRAVLQPLPPTQWFPCPSCHTPVPVVVPRDPPPLFSWEVYPGLYPTLPRPRPPRWRAQRVTAVVLFGLVVLAGGFGGLLGYYGYAAAAPASYVVSGNVFVGLPGGPSSPAGGASVQLTDDSGNRFLATTTSGGAFRFAGVPAGGVTLNVSFPGYAPVEVETFVSPVYDAGTQGLVIVLAPGTVANGSTINLSPFPDLESLLASIGGAVVLLGVVALVAFGAAWGTFRSDRPALGVVGGASGVTAPLALFLLGLGTVFPLLVASTALLAALGAFALALRAVELAQTGPAPGPE